MRKQWDAMPPPDSEPIEKTLAPATEAVGGRLARMPRGHGATLERLRLWLRRVERMLPAIFVACAGPLAIFFAVAIPAFRVPDEVRHFARAEQIGAGGILTWRQNSLSAGGIVDTNIFKLDDLVSGRVDWDGEGRIDFPLLREAQSIAWGGERRFAELHGAGQYPPFHYAPTIIAIWAGKALRLSIAETLLLSRLVNGAVAVGIAALALALMPYGRAAMFAVLALPMTLHQFASASQDAMLIALTAPVVALVARALWARRPLGRGPLIAVALIIAANAMARPPMLAVALVLLVPGLADSRRWPRTGLKIAALVTLAVLAWVIYVSLYTRSLLGDSETLVSPSANLMRLLERPLFFFELISKTWRIGYDNLARQFVGELGAFEVILPTAYHFFMGMILAVGLLAALLERNGPGWRATAIIGAAVLTGIFGILLSLYITWTPVHETYIEGVQGRYFLPLALVLVAAIPAMGTGATLRAILTSFVAATPLVTYAVVPWAVLSRYYISPG